MLSLRVIIGLLAVGLVSSLPVRPQTQDVSATIINSGSTNRPGFRIVVSQSGSAEFIPGPRRGAAQPQRSGPTQVMPAPELIERFFFDLKAASPLSSLPAVHCVKSVSFGSRLTIVFGGEQTPDLSCGDGGIALVANLARDANEIVALFRDQ